MSNAIIAAWNMSLEGVKAACELLKNGGEAPEAVKKAVNLVEDNPGFSSVGYGGLPNRLGEVELDAAYMDGSTGYYGGILGAKGIANPIDAAIKLSKRHLNCLLSGAGAEQFARIEGLAFKNMLTAESKKKWEEALEKEKTSPGAYRGHDTVCVIVRKDKHIAAGVSTSGLFMKEPGRIGDSPIVGAGLYADSAIGAVSATGHGEDIIRGCLSYEAVRLMEQGRSAQEACKTALAAHIARMKSKGFAIKDVSLVALGADGSFGAATNLKDGEFTFVYADETHPPAVWTISGGVQHIAAR
ncbi:MAG: N(4)-(beta-N-acetylglucosaminyl)-L-asparaginase [Treponema sp.]|nr:N(4)-(beta-N-acetylglucosaminyl)-L-asparaginase [Treponema sp.]